MAGRSAPRSLRWSVDVCGDEETSPGRVRSFDVDERGRALVRANFGHATTFALGDHTPARRVCPKVHYHRTASSIPVQSNFNDEDEDNSVSGWLRRNFRADLGRNSFGGMTLEDRLGHFSSEVAERSKEETAWVFAKELGFGNALTAAEVRAMYEGTSLQGSADKVVLVLKLGLALLGYGACTVDAEAIMLGACSGLDLPVNCIRLGHRELQASFGNGPCHLLPTTGEVMADKLVAVTRLANHLTSSTDVTAAIMVLDEITGRRKPYSGYIQLFSFYCLCVGAAVAIRTSTYRDAVAVAMIAPFPIAVIKLAKRCRFFLPVLDFCIAASVGMGTSIVWRFVQRDATCHVPVWYLSVLIDFLPGGQLVYGAYEFEFSSLINASSRLVRALLQCMVLAAGITIGWQVFGHNLASADLHGQTGAIASLPPAIECDNPAFKKSHWLEYAGVYNIPMVFVILVGLNVRVRDMPGPMLISYLSMLIYGLLTNSDLVDLPLVVTNVLTVFLAGTLASLYDFLTAVPASISVLPVICFLAPGAGTLKAIIASLHRAAHDQVDSADLWGDLVLEGMSYAVGLHLATALWRPLYLRRAAGAM
mmetsp:Transcript_92790/g.276817  ORF Transcript_92790/g.276817 Transcript_92790/m.276817 type:complete len:592 (+) Transcript_92790:68-1843(+)